MNSHPIVTLGGTDAETSAQPVVAKNGNPKRTSHAAAAKVRLTIQPISERFPALEEQEIILTYFAPLVGEVKVAGNFNGWRPDAAPLKNTGAGEWVVRLMLRSGQYEYLFVVDGRWTEDPQAAQRMTNPHGGFNSVLAVPLSVRTSIL
jgi:1,4-alpha-glucan branching enzyme